MGEHDRPKNVARFEWLIYSSLFVGMVYAIAIFRDLDQRSIGSLPFVLGLFCLLIWLIARRRKNWARWILLILWLAAAYPEIKDLVASTNPHHIVTILPVVRDLLQLAAVSLLFSPSSNSWFRPRTDSNTNSGNDASVTFGRQQ